MPNPEQDRAPAIADFLRELPNADRDALVCSVVSRWPDATGDEIERAIELARPAHQRGSTMSGSIYSGPGYYEVRGNYGPQVCFVELVTPRRKRDNREWFKVSATAEDREEEGTMLAHMDRFADLLIRKVEDGQLT